MTDEDLVAVLDRAAAAVTKALGNIDDWGLAGTTEGQHHSDIAADSAALAVLDGGGLGVLSEESGLHHGDREVCVVLDPVDGSTNASRGIPWYATSLCAVDADGPRAAVVVNLSSGVRYTAVRGRGASRDGVGIRPSSCTVMGDALVALTGHAPRPFGWYQYRALGAAALDLCAVGAGLVDAYVDCGSGGHGPWDYLGGLLVCLEAGAVVADAAGRDLVTLEHSARRSPVAAATPELLALAMSARAAGFEGAGNSVI
jgi:myo-inositol-1(or 4)-monophosphatase